MPEEQERPATEQNSGEDDKVFDAEYVRKLRAEAARYRTEAKANADAAERLKTIEDEGKTEVQRLTEAVRQAEQGKADAEARSMRLEVALEKGLTLKQTNRLAGTSLEELRTDADELLEEFAGKQQAPPPSRKPVDATRPGSNGAETPPESDPAKLADAVLERVVH